MPRPLHEQVIVITGASSGIGRLTALRFARAGAKVVLAARNEEALQTLEQEITNDGGTALVVPTDVGNWEAVQHLANTAVNYLGRIDTWVNNAGVSVYGTVEETSVEEFERVLHVNVMSQVYGAKAVIPHMKRQGGGVIINVGSALSKRSVPLQAAYCASKHAVKGFTDSLRMELKRDESNIDVVLIMPASMNTPFFTHARSNMGVKPMPIAPVYPPQDVAQAICLAAVHPKRDIHVGGAGAFFTWMEYLNPGLVDRVMLTKGYMFKQQKTDEPDDGIDNLYTPVDEMPARIEGEFAEMTKPSLYNRLVSFRPTWQQAMMVPLLGAAGVFGRRILSR